MDKEKYVPNDVYKFSIYFSNTFDVNVYVDKEAFDSDEGKVKEAYFTQDRIEELKNKLIAKIRECPNPFNIYCVDMDGNYKVTADMIFKG